jgi:3-phenylpropionate/cinnamic acid dioxygenase small subunit
MEMEMQTDDKIAIQKLLYHAAYSLDVRDLETLTSCFAEQAVIVCRQNLLDDIH